MSEPCKTVSLVLGSGGARGHAHIGVIRALCERGLSIQNIAGTSMGALIGGIYATGELDTYSDWANKLEKKDVVRLLDFSFPRHSLFKGERIFDVLRELVGDRRARRILAGERERSAVGGRRPGQSHSDRTDAERPYRPDHRS